MGYKMNRADREVPARQHPKPTHECRACRLKTTPRYDYHRGTMVNWCGICGSVLTVIKGVDQRKA